MNRIAVIDKEKCEPKKCNYICKNVCPINRKGDDCIVSEKSKPPTISEELCIGCGLCVKKCPFNAITIVNLPQPLNDPIHRYGENEFVLFRLPTPLQGKVVGLVGPNGVGKTTALSILSGRLKPNLGSEAGWDKIIENFRGSELQSHLEKLSKNKISVSHKPQEIDKIPLVYKNKIGKLLKNTDQKLVKRLNLNPLLYKKPDQLSGGELQRVSIAVCLSKKADIYCIDEPGSFNDVYQRVIISKLIREFAVQTGKPVVIVEHDLAMMDMVADYVHILYGKPGAYGVVSALKTTRKGINEYLAGYLSDENVRIRPESVQFDMQPKEEKHQEDLFGYSSLTKKYDNFSLEVSEGLIKRGETIAVVGANALGKTTFLKMLAGEIKPTNGFIKTDLRIAYKPQYLESKYSGTVRQLLSGSKDFIKEWYKNNLLVKLGLQSLLDRNVQDLSGGELQRVSIAYTLGREADIVALDEPSAYIDVESRWELASVIKKVCDIKGFSAFVVDHDIQFIDYISDRILIFKGEPAKHGETWGPFSKKRGMNQFLKELDISYRRDEKTNRPRINKPQSQKDREQKKKGKYYYG